LYPGVRHWEELVHFIDKNSSPKEPYILTSIFMCTLEKDKLEEEYLGLYTHQQKINDPVYGQISYNCCLVNAFMLKHGLNVKILLVEMMRATGTGIAKHEIRPTKVIPASRVKARREQQLIFIESIWNVLKRVEETEKRRERRTVGERMILGLM
jgi:hypothetical protein